MPTALNRTRLVTPLKVRSLADIEEIERTPLSERLAVGTTYEAFDAVARAHADRPAIHWLPNGFPTQDDRTISYREFAARVRQTANFIRSRGLTRRDVVAYLLPNLPETHFVIAGAQAACVAMPLNPLLEKNHISEMLDRVGAKMLFAVRGGAYAEFERKALDLAAAAQGDLQVVFIDVGQPQASGYTEQIGAFRDDALDFDYDARPEDPACYMHTGGTTGAPKMAPHTHWAEVYQAWTIASLADLRVTDSTIAGLPLYHATALRITGLGCWIGGASVILIGPDGYRNLMAIMRFWETVETYKATTFLTVPTVYSALLNVPTQGRDVSSLRLASSGAAPLPVEIIRRFDETFGIPISEGYGLTEGTCVCARNPQDGPRKVGSIGLRVPYQHMKVVELGHDGAWRRDCGIGEAGVLAINGPNAISGYLEPERDNELLLGDGWINTGDLAYQDEDGYFFISGRRKDLIIRSGHNIDPVLIEDVLHQHPDVVLAAAVGMPDDYAGELPVAFVTLQDGATADPDQLRAYVAERISEQPAAPKLVFCVDAMPVTDIGKISKSRLRCRAAEHVVTERLKEALPGGATWSVRASPSAASGTQVDVSVSIPDDVGADAVRALATRVLGSFTFGHDLRIEGRGASAR